MEKLGGLKNMAMGSQKVNFSDSSILYVDKMNLKDLFVLYKKYLYNYVTGKSSRLIIGLYLVILTGNIFVWSLSGIETINPLLLTIVFLILSLIPVLIFTIYDFIKNIHDTNRFFKMYIVDDDTIKNFEINFNSTIEGVSLVFNFEGEYEIDKLKKVEKNPRGSNLIFESNNLFIRGDGLQVLENDFELTE